jgi:DnaJ-class molecular chaperone
MSAHIEDGRYLCLECEIELVAYEGELCHLCDERARQEEEERRAEEESTCPSCAGTGIGHGDPDTSRCGACRGWGSLARVRSYADREDLRAEYDSRRDGIIDDDLPF